MNIVSSIDCLKDRYKLYGNEMLDKIKEKHGEYGADIKLKVEHGISMSDSVGKTTLNSNLFNESYVESGQIDGLLHDVGRFYQYLLSGTLKDYELKNFIDFEDHGRLGNYILSKNNNELLRYFIPETTIYDYILKQVIYEHTTINNLDYKYELTKLINVFPNYDLSEIIYSGNQELVDKLIALKLKILREEDSLEILQKVRDGLWKPAIGCEEKHHVHNEIWDQFTNFEFINMAELKSKGLWTCNAGFLLRYSLIYNNINFVGTLKTLLEDNTLDKVYQNQINNVTNDNDEIITDSSLYDKRLKDAYEFITLVTKELINTSPDGIIITPESREQAKELVKKQF